MKKGILLLVFGVVLTASTFALDVSVGGGFQFGSLWVIQSFNDDARKTKPVSNGGFGNWTYDGTEKVDIVNTTAATLLGFDFFADITYAEVNIGMVFNPVGRLSGEASSGTSAKSTGIDTFLNVSALGKYPFKIGDTLTIFPLLGIDYQIFLAATDGQGASYGRSDKFSKVDANGDTKREEVLSYFDNFWIKLGVGVDVALGKKFFLRNELLWGACLREELLNNMVWYNKLAPNINRTEMGGFAHGLSYKVAIGYNIIGGK